MTVGRASASTLQKVLSPQRSAAILAAVAIQPLVTRAHRVVIYPRV
jgi:hypothetical protein